MLIIYETIGQNTIHSDIMSHSENEVNVVIVGSGPVGLLNAVGLLNKNPQLKIIILEKEAAYTRHHVLQMDYEQLDKYLRAVDGNDVVIRQLRDQVKKNKHIRTSEIQTKLEQRVLKLGAEIIYKNPVTSIQKDVFDKYPNAKLIIGADGAHSVISAQTFGPDNIEKFPFDFVMQFRYEVLGDVNPIKLPTLVQFMQSYGTTCDEYVGKKGSDGKTPITFQIMITKEQFEELYPHAKSKTPLKPFCDDIADQHSDQAKKMAHVWPLYIEQVKGYLGLRLREYTPAGQIVDLHSATISVNEAPATKAKEIFKEVDGRHIILSGDAKLGLSYFKGLNAGVETSAKLLPILANNDFEARKKQCIEYAQWFDRDYGPSKVKEVEHYSVFIINLVVKVFRFLQLVLGSGFFINQKEAERSVDLYLAYLNQLQLPHTDKGAILLPADPKLIRNWQPYPHRDELPGHVLSFQHTEIARYYRDIRKNVTDTIAPYKSVYYILRDMLVPVRALRYMVSGLGELAIIIPWFIVSSALDLYAPAETLRSAHLKQNIHQALLNFQEGVAKILLGLSLALSTVFMPIKLIIRFIATYFAEKKNGGVLIENNSAMTQILQHVSINSNSIEQTHAYCVDVHRKFQKGIARHQKTKVDPQQEALAFSRCYPTKPQSYQDYLRLFKQTPAAESSDNHSAKNKERPNQLKSN